MADPTTVAFVSLGCAKNLVDSEKMLGQLAEAGCVITAEETDADVMVINTCGFLQASRNEADEVIANALSLKQAGAVGRVVVAGCLVQRDGVAIADRLAGIDALVGVNNRDDIVRAVLGQSPGNRPRPEQPDLFLSEYHPFIQLDMARLRLTPRHYAYLRISEGCDQKCTFCTIPSIRGTMHCKPPDVVLAEARELIADGATELHLIGQDTTSYGVGNSAFDGGLASLLRGLSALDGIEWVRLMYAYPTSLTDEIIDAIGESEHVCNYIDVPLQHISDRVLKAMHRRIDRKTTERLLQRLRDRIPGVAIRTTLIAGFPGETDEDFAELEQFVSEFRFDALGVFPYSHEAETPSARMKKPVCSEVAEQRVDALMTAQQKVAFSLADQRLGSRFRVLLDERVEPGVMRGRHEGQAPLVDGTTLVKQCDAGTGEFLEVRCTGRDTYDLVATPTRVPLRVLAG